MPNCTKKIFVYSQKVSQLRLLRWIEFNTICDRNESISLTQKKNSSTLITQFSFFTQLDTIDISESSSESFKSEGCAKFSNQRPYRNWHNYDMSSSKANWISAISLSYLEISIYVAGSVTLKELRKFFIYFNLNLLNLVPFFPIKHIFIPTLFPSHVITMRINNFVIKKRKYNCWPINE